MTRAQKPREPAEVPAPQPEEAPPAATEPVIPATEAPATEAPPASDVVPPEASSTAPPVVATPAIEEPLPTGAIEEELTPPATASETLSEEAPAAPLREHVLLNGPASYGPVIIDGQLTRAKARVVYHVADAEERADLLATGKFRGATSADFPKPRKGDGPVTRESLPPGALKGGLIKP